MHAVEGLTADSSKVGRQGFTPIAPTASVDVPVTDAGEIAARRERGVEVVLA